MKLNVSAEAEAELEIIGDWIARDNSMRALSFVSELREACQSILKFPEASQLVSRFEKSGVRRKVHGNYLIFYTLEVDAVNIMHILHGARDFEPILFP
jgi:toxin ParE1/3/4